MCARYTLEWLDSLITVSLNPGKTDLNSLSDEELLSVKTKITEEKVKLLTILKNQIFCLTKEKQIALLVGQWHSSLIILLDQVLKYHKSFKSDSKVKEVYNTLISSLEELLSFIEERFFAHLSLNERVPVTYLAETGNELKHKADKLKSKLFSQDADNELANIVLNNLYNFIDRLKGDFPVSFRDLLYQKDLFKELESLEFHRCETRIFTALDKLLILLNFNSRAYMTYLTKRLAERINANENIIDRLESLLFHFKLFNQMHRKPGAILNPQYGGLKRELSNWFTQEIFYIEKKLHLNIVPIIGSTEQKGSRTASPKNEPQKLMCILSVDQMALILRSADDLKIIEARSLNSIFKTIVPHLSTPFQENISYDSMRSKSYTAETRDKEIVIQTLEQMIKRIKEY